jgi:hypothetical protein
MVLLWPGNPNVSLW